MTDQELLELKAILLEKVLSCGIPMEQWVCLKLVYKTIKERGL